MSWLREEVLRRADIVEVVGEYLPLKKRGANYWALSPFKPEKTPSFAVSPSKQIFKCFASGKGGDVIRFVMEIEGLSYGEALRKLAEKYNIEIPAEREKAPSSQERQRYLSLYEEATRFFQEKLLGSPAERYLRQRGLTPATLAQYRIGYAPPEGHALADHLRRLGYAEEVLVSWGLLLRQEGTGRLYDRFRDRVIFPIQDEQGAVIAFAGRAIGEAADQPKYLNSPETPFYTKSEVLYGLSFARNTLRKGTPALIVEGYMDVLSLHQAGFLQAVATCGTALTESHLGRLRRYTRELILLYDSDEAGQAAARRALLPALQHGFFVKVLSVPDGKDPDEYLQKEGTEAFSVLLSRALSWPRHIHQQQPTTPSASDRYQLLHQLGEALHALPDPFMRRAYAEEIQEVFQIPPDFWENFREVEAAARRPDPQNLPRITAERELLRAFLLYPEADYGGIPLWQLLQEELRPLTFSDPPAEELRKRLCEWPYPFPPTLLLLSEQLSPETQDWAAGLLVEKVELSPHWRTWDDSPLQEDPLQLVESNLYLLHLHQVQFLLEENLRHLALLSPEDPAYAEHMAIHQVLLRQRTELAHKQGTILPYRKG